MEEIRTPKYLCVHCDYKPRNKKDFYAHANVHTFQKRGIKLSCFFCKTLLGSFKVHRRHVANCQKPHNQEAFEEHSIFDRFWQCEHCQEKIGVKEQPNFDDHKNVTTHLLMHIEMEVVNCPRPTCDKSYQVRQSMINHINSHKAHD